MPKVKPGKETVKFLAIFDHASFYAFPGIFWLYFRPRNCPKQASRLAARGELPLQVGHHENRKMRFLVSPEQSFFIIARGIVTHNSQSPKNHIISV
jgi:hypothetical protein